MRTAPFVTLLVLCTSSVYAADETSPGALPLTTDPMAAGTAGQQGSGTTEVNASATRGMADPATKEVRAKTPNSVSGDLMTQTEASGANGILLKAIRAAKLDGRLRMKGPYTIFAPSDAAFGSLPDGKIEDLMEPKRQDTLKLLLSYHIVKGRFDTPALLRMIDAAPSNRVELTTLSGGKIYATLEDGKITLQDTTGAKSTVFAADRYARNGVIHNVDRVVTPSQLARKRPMTRSRLFSE